MKIFKLSFVLLCLTVSSLTAGQVVLDHVEGSWLDGATYKIIPNSPIEFHIRVMNDNAQPVTSLTNGFSVFGPSSFTPASGYSLIDPDIFIFQIYTGFSNNGSGADTVGFTSGFFGSLPPGFDDVVYVITTGNVPEEESICLDSTFFPPTGSWLWAPTGMPYWDGPHCFLAEQGCLPIFIPTFVKYIDTLKIPQCYGTYHFDFEAEVDSLISENLTYQLISGPGTIDPSNGVWSYIPLESDYGTEQIVTLSAYDNAHPNCETQFTFVAKFSDTYLSGDIDYSCWLDIADLVYYVAYAFQGGPPPPQYELADINKDGYYDIADIVYLVSYMFFDGPPPVE